MDERQFSAIVDKLDKILRLLTIEAVKGKEKEQDKIDLLDSLGFKSSEIDKLLGKSPGYSSVVLSQLKRKKAPKPTEETPPQTSPATPEVLQ